MGTPGWPGLEGGAARGFPERQTQPTGFLRPAPRPPPDLHAPPCLHTPASPQQHPSPRAPPLTASGPSPPPPSPRKQPEVTPRREPGALRIKSHFRTRPTIWFWPVPWPLSVACPVLTRVSRQVAGAFGARGLGNFNPSPLPNCPTSKCPSVSFLPQMFTERLQYAGLQKNLHSKTTLQSIASTT